MSLLESLQAYGTVLENESMKKHTTFRIGGQVDYYIFPDNETSLMQILILLEQNDLPYHILGRGSNLIVDDEDFHGAIINLDRTLNDYSFEPNGVLVAQAGCSIIHLSAEAANRSLSGLEFAYGIPGSIGGGLYMNAGAYKSNLSEILLEVCVLKDRKVCWITKEELDYSYRHSSFQNHKDWIILAGKFQLQKKDSQSIRSLMESRRERRMNTQPLNMPCAGSVFRNPQEKAAWQIIDELGLRGHQIGGAKISEKHSNFIVNENGSAKCQDVLDLINLVKRRAKEEFNIDLRPEIEYISWNKGHR